MHPGIFREYDIRGLVDKEITDDDVLLLGRTIGTYMEQRGVKRITVGRDCRLSSDHYRDLLLEGLLSTGRQVIDIGICPSPLLYFSVWHYKTDGAVMITASHNPSDYNGFKIMIGKGTLFGSDIQDIYKLSQSGPFVSGRGAASQDEIIGPYIEEVSGIIKLEGDLHVAIDTGNGTAGPVIIPLMKKLGIAVEALYPEMDGRFPNHPADPTVEANIRELQQAVRNKKLRAGFAYDGDADRVGIIDENGTPIWGDMILTILARSVLEKHPGATFIAEVKCSQNFYDDVKKRGGNAIMWKAGHSLIKQKMAETGALLCGEMSGHIFFKDRWYGFDDGIYSSLRFAELLTRNRAPLSTWLSDLPPIYNTPEVKQACPDLIKFKVVEKVARALKDYNIISVDGVRITFPDGWGLVRASNTGPNLILRFEARSERRLGEIKDLLTSAVNQAMRECA
ncbi:MAG: phosphomannomutase/phosphoglucomutase [Desulfarculales bacterium]|jgi:phosphomannomutase/phosphoglucomutase|nr:phosphomannomutase/phosphoglucomutase [Desulfarculales bacterium]